MKCECIEDNVLAGHAQLSQLSWEITWSNISTAKISQIEFLVDYTYLNAFDNGLIPREELLSLNNLPTVVCSAVEVNHYTKSPAMVTNIHLPLWWSPLRHKMRTNECWDWTWNSLRWYVLRWRRRKSKCSRQSRSFHVCIRMSTRSKLATLYRQVDTLETQCNLMSTGSKVGTFVDRFETCYLCRQVDTLETCVPLATGRHARNLIPHVDTFQPYAGRQVDTLETETSQRGARSFVQISLCIYLSQSIVWQ